MNHKLFDECSQKYKVEKQKEKDKLRERDSAWTKIESKARQNPNVSLYSHEKKNNKSFYDYFSIKTMHPINLNFIDQMIMMMMMAELRISPLKKLNKKLKKYENNDFSFLLEQVDMPLDYLSEKGFRE